MSSDRVRSSGGGRGEGREPGSSLDSLVFQCLEADDPEAELARLTAGDPGLFERAQRVLARVRADERELGALGGSSAPDVDAADGYELLEPIGRGGMGVVWLAEQLEPVRRRVALKVIKLGMDTEEVLERFELEKQALARMGHPNVATVFDAGMTRRGQPYYVMEYVPGPSITAYCDQERASIASRLELFTQVCEGVQHAHQRGVIHRDLKPSNVLVSQAQSRPLAKIIDFGLARMIAPMDARGDARATFLTRDGVLVGTPAYMSPEQAASSPAAIDTRTDVYSLGVLLYELLTGDLPYTSDRLQRTPLLEIQRIIREEEPARPSARLAGLGERAGEVTAARQVTASGLLRILRGDLDWIVMKALEKEPDRRYATVNELAADVRRFLRGEPVLASPPSAMYRVRKYVRRRRLQVAAITAVALTLIGATIVSTSLFLEARASEGRAKESAAAERRAKDEAVGQRARAEELREEAEAQRGEAEAQRQAAETQGEIALREGERAEQRSRELRRVVETLANDIGGLIATLPGAGEAKVALTRLAVPYLEELARQYPDDLALHRDLALTYVRLGGTLGSPYYANLGETGLAREVLTKGRDLAAGILEREPGNPDTVYLVRLACITLGDVLRSTGDLEGARACLEQALAVDAGELSGEAGIKDRIGLGDLSMRLAEIAYAEGRLDESEAHCVEGIERAESVLADAPGFLLAYPQLASFQRNRSRVASAQGRRDDFLEYTDMGIGTALELLDRVPRHRAGLGLMANFHRDLAMDAYEHGEFDSALELWAETCARLEELVRLEPGDSRASLELSEAWLGQGRTLAALGEQGPAREARERAASLARQIHERDPASLAAGINLASALLDLARSRREGRDLEGCGELLEQVGPVTPAGASETVRAQGLLVRLGLDAERAYLAMDRALLPELADATRVARLREAQEHWRQALADLAGLRASSLPASTYEGRADEFETAALGCAELLANPEQRAAAAAE